MRFGNNGRGRYVGRGARRGVGCRCGCRRRRVIRDIVVIVGGLVVGVVLLGFLIVNDRVIGYVGYGFVVLVDGGVLRVNVGQLVAVVNVNVAVPCVVVDGDVGLIRDRSFNRLNTNRNRIKLILIHERFFSQYSSYSQNEK